MTPGTLGLAFLAGALSILSPCVLPLLPIVLGSAAAEHRLAPAALAAGVALTFVAIGLFVATIGFAIGLDAGVFRLVAAVLLIGVGLLLLVPRLGDPVATSATWSPDGSQIAFSRDSAIYLANADGSQPRKLATLEGDAFGLHFSADDRKIRVHAVVNQCRSARPAGGRPSPAAGRPSPPPALSPSPGEHFVP